MNKLILIAIVVFAVSCSDTAQKNDNARKDGFTPELKTKEDSLFKEVMDGHDVGMSRMGKISKYLRLIQQSLDSIDKLPKNKLDKNYQQTLLDIKENLTYAEFSMNKWMEDFNIDSAKGDESRRLQYLEAERDKVGIVKKAILSSLERADSLYIKK